jgi:hypothetical protein
MYIDTSQRPQDVTTTLIVTQSPLLLEIQLLEEDASRVGMTKELCGRRISQNVNIGLLKRWIHICENKHREKCESVWWKGSRGPSEGYESPGCSSHGYSSDLRVSLKPG